MEQQRKSAIAFLVIGMAFNTIGITQRAAGVKTTFHLLGIVFVIIAIVRLAKLRQDKDK
jgi:hypothetical protein